MKSVHELLAQHTVNKLASCDLSYLTATEYNSLSSAQQKMILSLLQDKLGYTAKLVTCSMYAKELKRAISAEKNIIRHIQSKSSTNKLSYADWYRAPGTKDIYREYFHYQHVYTPDDKHQIKVAKHRISLCEKTGKVSRPDTSKDAPIYVVRDANQPWRYGLIMIQPLIGTLKKEA